MAIKQSQKSKICICNRDKLTQRVSSAAVLTQSHPKIILVTLLFFSSSKMGFFGRGEGDWINVALMGISGSAKTMPKIKMTRNFYSGNIYIYIQKKHEDSQNQMLSSSMLSTLCFTVSAYFNSFSVAGLTL